MKLPDIIDTATRLAVMEAEAEALRDTVAADTPTLDALIRRVEGWGVLRNRDGLTVTPTRFAQWDLIPHSSGAYLDALVHVVANRDGESTRGELRIRTNVTAVTHDNSRGECLRFSAFFTYGALPDGARRIIDEKLNESWAEVTPNDTAVLWNEAVTYEAARAVRQKQYDTARRFVNLIVRVES
jgi:uncharacterized protein with PIN domain